MSKRKPETYLSIDVETDGPVPGINSMLSLGAVIVNADGSLGDQWSMNLYPPEDAHQDSDTMEWWSTQSEAWKAVMQNRQEPAVAMADFVHWVKDHGKLIPMAWPIAFDMPFVTYYCQRFTGERPLGFAGVDLRSLVWGATSSRGYYDLSERWMNELTEMTDTTGLQAHVALDDAIGQARGFAALLSKRKRIVP